MSFTRTGDRILYDYIQDGTGGTDGRVISQFNFINVCSPDFAYLSIIYYDIENKLIRYINGRDPKMTFYTYINLENPPILMTFINLTGFIIDTTYNLHYLSNSSIISTHELNNNKKNLKFVKTIVDPTYYAFLLSINNSIYQIMQPSIPTSIPFLLLVDNDYDGRDFSTCINSGDNCIYVAYTSNKIIKVLRFVITPGEGNSFISINQNSKIIVATFADKTNLYSIPRLIIFNNVLKLYLKDTKTNFIYATTISNNKITIGTKLKAANDYKLNVVKTNLILYYIGLDNTINRLLLQTSTTTTTKKIVHNIGKKKIIRFIDKISYNENYINTNLKINNQIASNLSFDVTNIEYEEYIYYIDINNKLHQLWNPIPIVTINYNFEITSIAGCTDDITNSIVPPFNTSISDYAISTSMEDDAPNYTININGNTDIGGYVYPGQLIQINDTKNKKKNKTYYIKILPKNIECAVTNKFTNYVPGYYLTSYTFNGTFSNYYVIYDSNGVPVWYKKNNSQLGDGNSPQIASLFLGNSLNTVVTAIFDGYTARKLINVDTLAETNYYIQPDTRGGTPSWDVHESQVIKSPLDRNGNMILVSYTDPFYLQEISPNNTLVWDWFASDYLNDPGGDYYHINSIDVHPITGHLVLSARHHSTIFSIDYNTGNIRWIINPTNDFTSQLKDATNINILIPTNEPTVPHPYNGTSAQHDARWHTNILPLTPGNEIISAFDDGTFNGFAARGVIYEIDLVNNNAIFRGMVYSETGSSGYMGSYKIIDEPNGSTSHACDFVQQHPCLRENSSVSLTNKMPTQNQLFNLDLSGDHYRISKATSNDLSITSMRKTSGMPFSTP